MLPPDPAPSVAIPTLGNFHITGTNPVTGGNQTFGQIDISGLSREGGPTITLTSSHPDIVPNTSIVTPASQQFFGYQVFFNTRPPAADTNVTITASDGRYSFSSVLRVLKPASAPVLSGVSVNPSSVVGGNPSTGTVTLTAAAPSGGAAVSLSDNSTATSVPASVTVAAGSTTANFTITTTSVIASTSSTISGTFGGVTRSAPMMVNPAASGQTATLTVSASGRSGERVTSSPAGINVAVGSSGSASFSIGASITLSVTNGRDAIWSGACSSGGSKRRTCTFTFTGAASVTANVQ
jgi:hypothetical protein